jgi:hypothetical protein
MTKKVSSTTKKGFFVHEEGFFNDEEKFFVHEESFFNDEERLLRS